MLILSSSKCFIRHIGPIALAVILSGCCSKHGLSPRREGAAETAHSDIHESNIAPSFLSEVEREGYRAIRILSQCPVGGECKPWTVCQIDGPDIAVKDVPFSSSAKRIFDSVEWDRSFVCLVWGGSNTSVRCVNSAWYDPKGKRIILFLHLQSHDSDIGLAGTGAMIECERVAELEEAAEIGLIEASHSRDSLVSRRKISVVKKGKFDVRRAYDEEYVKKYNSDGNQ